VYKTIIITKIEIIFFKIFINNYFISNKSETFVVFFKSLFKETISSSFIKSFCKVLLFLSFNLTKFSFKFDKFSFEILNFHKSKETTSAFIIECLLQEGHSTSIFMFVQAAQTISILLSQTNDSQFGHL
jgi:hypothetical protein